MIYGTDQQRQIYLVLEYIEEHLEESLPLERLSKVSTYSSFYFQKLFKGIVGETPANYVKRLRIERAAHLLIYEQGIPITEIAFMCGFTSLSYFTYSFNTYFQVSPKKWREGAYLEHFSREYHHSKKSKQMSHNVKDNSSSSTYTTFKWLALERVKVVELPNRSIVKRYSRGPYTEGIPQVWEEFFHYANARGLLNQGMVFGTPKNNPYITPPSKSRYDYCIEIKKGNAEDLENEIVTQFTGGKHVLYEFAEPVDYAERNKLIECYAELYSYWLPGSGYKYLGNPIELVQFEQQNSSLTVVTKIKAIALAIEPK
ncbi:AraC family transcriptional regulator [Guptibacillus hwajinpoensis]|uniref:AraC family transcriptional regulator n=1 Tax=Guptibacillus hwajinpoensis TaxID=208199 RepID=UPI001F1AC323|nr:helix-turn-helix domain-containing protein [Alkalihalobacillus macyae]